jgi:tetratricopeptide (TPR) repeat protein
MELLFAKGEALPVVLARLADTAQPVRRRVDLADLVWKLYVRESDPRILPALVALVGDLGPAVRRVVARALGNIGKEDLVHPLLDQLERETEEEVQLEILKALELLDEWQVSTNWNFKIYGGDAFSPHERGRFVAALQKIHRSTQTDSLRVTAEEFLEKIAGQISGEADELVVRADLDGALALYEQALSIKPDSKNVHTSLGKFYYFNGEREKGLATLAAHGMALHVPRIEMAPTMTARSTIPYGRAPRDSTLSTRMC